MQSGRCASSARAAAIASSTVSPAMKRRAKLAGVRMPYRDGQRLQGAALREEVEEGFRSAAEHQCVRPVGHQQVFDRPRVVAQHVAVAHAEAAALERR